MDMEVKKDLGYLVNPFQLLLVTMEHIIKNFVITFIIRSERS